MNYFIVLCLYTLFVIKRRLEIETPYVAQHRHAGQDLNEYNPPFPLMLHKYTTGGKWAGANCTGYNYYLADKINTSISLIDVTKKSNPTGYEYQ